MYPRKTLRKLFAILLCGISQIHMVSDLVHQDVPEIKSMDPIQIGLSEGVGMKKHAAVPVLTIKGTPTPPTLQLLLRS
jgi:hypothetical protein